MHPLFPGAKLGRYRLVKRLAEGSNGTLWSAVDTMLKVRLALKVLAPSGSAERLQRELFVSRCVTHAGVNRVFELHEHEGLRFLSMEVVDGVALRTLLTAPLSPPRAVRIALGICAALAAAHEAGVLHRNITPATLIVGRHDTVKLIDFAFAKATSLPPITDPGSVVGTLGYIAPEVRAGGAASTASDLYSVGVVLYQCLTLRAARPAVPPSALADGISPQLDDVVLRAVAEIPAERFLTAQELAEALQAAPEARIVDDDETETLGIEDETTLLGFVDDPTHIDRAPSLRVAALAVSIAFVLLLVLVLGGAR